MLKTRGFAFVVLSICLAGFTFVFIEVKATPDNDGSCSCHNEGGYDISTSVGSKINVTGGDQFNIDIQASGPGVIVEFHPEARDNGLFGVFPNQTIFDNGPFDQNSALDAIAVVFQLTAPEANGTYQINIFARSPGPGQPKLVCLEFTITVLSPISLPWWQRIDVWDHWTIYLTMIALILGIGGTIRYELNHHKTKSHAISMSLALILCCISTFLVLPTTIDVLLTEPAVYLLDWAICSHIIIGWGGIIAGIIAFIVGLAGIRSKKPGYLALGCWAYNFIFGIIYWGIYL